MTFDEKGKVVKSVQPIKTLVRTLSYFQVCGVWEGWCLGRMERGFLSKTHLKDISISER
jgi:hypothetical protein